MVIINKPLKTPSTEPFTEPRWMAFTERVRFQKTLKAYNIMNNICPQYYTKLSYIR